MRLVRLPLWQTYVSNLSSSHDLENLQVFRQAVVVSPALRMIIVRSALIADYALVLCQTCLLLVHNHHLHLVNRSALPYSRAMFRRA